jgi:type IV pilus assembly protein PilZ
LPGRVGYERVLGNEVGSAPPAESGANRRSHERFDAHLSVDVTSGETFLFAYITNISEMGIFLRSDAPLDVGTELSLRFSPADGPPFELPGMVVWINPLRPHGDNPNPGMGVRFSSLTPEQRERVVQLVRTVAYLGDDTGTAD